MTHTYSDDYLGPDGRDGEGYDEVRQADRMRRRRHHRCHGRHRHGGRHHGGRNLSGRVKHRLASDRAILFGVCAGLASRFGASVKVVRIAAIVALVFFPMGVVVGYGLLAWLMPRRAEHGTRSGGRRFRCPRQARRDDDQGSSRERLNALMERFRNLERKLDDAVDAVAGAS